MKCYAPFWINNFSWCTFFGGTHLNTCNWIVFILEMRHVFSSLKFCVEISLFLWFSDLSHFFRVLNKHTQLELIQISGLFLIPLARSWQVPVFDT